MSGATSTNNQAVMQVKLIDYAQSPLEKLYAAFRTCYSADTPIESGKRSKPGRSVTNRSVRLSASGSRPDMPRPSSRWSSGLRSPASRDHCRISSCAIGSVSASSSRASVTSNSKGGQDRSSPFADAGIVVARQARRRNSVSCWRGRRSFMRRRSRPVSRRRTPALSCPTRRRPIFT